MNLTNDPISVATANDINELVKLVNSAYRGESSTKGWTTEAALLDGIRTDLDSMRKQLETPGAVTLTYTESGNGLVGCVYLKKKADKLYLGMLTVSPILQAKGIGKQLLAAAENYARHQNCKVITMTVISVRRELIAWYERHGYRNTGETRPFPTGPEFGIPKQELEFIVMEKKL